MNSCRGDDGDGETGCCWSPLTSRRLFVDVMAVGDDIAADEAKVKHSCREKEAGARGDSWKGFGSFRRSCHTPSSGELQGALFAVLVECRVLTFV